MAAAYEFSVIELNLTEPARLGHYLLEQMLRCDLLRIGRSVVHNCLITVIAYGLSTASLHFKNIVIARCVVHPITIIN